MNATTGRINVRAGGGLDHPIKFQLQPGDGGVVGKCDDGKTWCEIALPGSEDAGWVYMPLLSPLSE